MSHHGSNLITGAYIDVCMVRKHRRRYVVFHVTCPEDVGLGLLIHILRKRTREMEREEYERIKPWFVYYENGWGIVRTGHMGQNELVTLINCLDGVKLDRDTLGIHVVGISGTLKSAFYKHIPEQAREEKHYGRKG